MAFCKGPRVGRPVRLRPLGPPSFLRWRSLARFLSSPTSTASLPTAPTRPVVHPPSRRPPSLSTMGLSISKLLSGLFGKKEMRESGFQSSPAMASRGPSLARPSPARLPGHFACQHVRCWALHRDSRCAFARSAARPTGARQRRTVRRDRRQSADSWSTEKATDEDGASRSPPLRARGRVLPSVPSAFLTQSPSPSLALPILALALLTRCFPQMALDRAGWGDATGQADGRPGGRVGLRLSHHRLSFERSPFLLLPC